MSRHPPGTCWFEVVRLQFGTKTSPGCRRPAALRRVAGPGRLRVPFIAGVALALLWSLGRLSGARLVYNATESEPRGWYLTTPARPPLTRGQLAVFPVPPRVAGLVVGRGWLPPGVPLLKRVGAIAGDTVCVDTVLRIRGEVVGPALSQDAAGRPLPVPRRGCFTVAPGFFFPVSRSSSSSFDARYFGELPVRTIRVTAMPPWTVSSAKWPCGGTWQDGGPIG